MDVFEYMFEIAQARSLHELDSLVEQAAFEDGLTNEEYEEIYDAALEKAQTW